jgi:hypothetical protein
MSVELSRVPDWVLKKFTEWSNEKIKEEKPARQA